jgi:hypothetical protein
MSQSSLGLLLLRLLKQAIAEGKRSPTTFGTVSTITNP